MSDNLQHPPAVKVGGRRLSISTSKLHKPHSAAPQATPPTEREPAPDYPRPAAPGGDEQGAHQQQQHHEEENSPKKERKHGQHDAERKTKEYAQWKAESTRPTRDSVPAYKAGARIVQPAKGFGL